MGESRALEYALPGLPISYVCGHVDQLRFWNDKTGSRHSTIELCLKRRGIRDIYIKRAGKERRAEVSPKNLRILVDQLAKHATRTSLRFIRESQSSLKRYNDLHCLHDRYGRGLWRTGRRYLGRFKYVSASSERFTQDEQFLSNSLASSGISSRVKFEVSGCRVTMYIFSLVAAGRRSLAKDRGVFLLRMFTYGSRLEAIPKRTIPNSGLTFSFA
jgi:hypothetical protein